MTCVHMQIPIIQSYIPFDSKFLTHLFIQLFIAYASQGILYKQKGGGEYNKAARKRGVNIMQEKERDGKNSEGINRPTLSR